MRSKQTTKKPAKRAAKAKETKPSADVETATPAPQIAQRTYTEEEKALALESVNFAGGNIASAARMLGIPENTLRDWAKGKYVSAQTLANYASKKRGLFGDRLTLLLDSLIDEMMKPEKMTEAGGKELGTWFGIIFDKSRLASGQPTAINENRDANADALQKLVDQARESLGVNEESARAWVLEHVPSAKKYVM